MVARRPYLLALVATLVPSLTACGTPTATREQIPAFDLVLRGGLLVDGTGSPTRVADVAITGDRIAGVGDLGDFHAVHVIDVGGLHVAPGFIDAHSHAAPGLATSELSGAHPLLAQGVTTVVVNPDGGGPIDLEGQRHALLADGLGVNVVPLVPFGSIRSVVMGDADRAPSTEELAEMKRHVREGMEAGAFGLSTGLFYSPQCFATTEEVIELARVAAESGGVYSSHIRDESDYTVGLVAAVAEVIRIARESGLVGVVTHVKALGPRVWGQSADVARLIEGARTAGVEVWADQYPYEASSTGLSAALVPRWAVADGGLRERLAEPEPRARIRDEMVENLDRRGGAARIVFARCPRRPAVEGRSLEEVAAEAGVEPVDAALELLGGTTIVSFNMHEDDVRAFMVQPWTVTSSDGGLVRMGQGRPHPRSYGAFPRKIRKYAVEEGVLSLEQAIHGMTGRTAELFRLADRGTLRPGALADVVVFDLARLRDRATYEDPHRLAEGVVHVLVNGRLAVENGQPTGELPGRVLRNDSVNVRDSSSARTGGSSCLD